MNKARPTGQLNRYLAGPLLLFLLLIPMNVGVYFLHRSAGFLVTLVLIACLVLTLWNYYRRRTAVLGEMITFAAQYGQVQKQLMSDFGLPYAVTDENGRLLWFNEAFAQISGKDKHQYHKSIESIFPEIVFHLSRMKPSAWKTFSSATEAFSEVSFAR